MLTLKQLAAQRDPEELRTFQDEIERNLKKRLQLEKKHKKMAAPRGGLQLLTKSYENRLEKAVNVRRRRKSAPDCSVDQSLASIVVSSRKLPNDLKPRPGGVLHSIRNTVPPNTTKRPARRFSTPSVLYAKAAMGASAAQQRVREHKRRQSQHDAARMQQDALRAQQLLKDQDAAQHQARVAARRLVMRKMMAANSKMAQLVGQENGVSSNAIVAIEATKASRPRRKSISKQEKDEVRRRVGWSAEEKQIRALIRWQGARHIVLGGIRIKREMERSAERKTNAEAKREAALQTQLEKLKLEAMRMLSKEA